MEKRKKPFRSRYSKFEGNNENLSYSLDLDSYEDLVDEGLNDTEIAQEFNIHEEFMKGIKKDLYKDH
jgi:hypothetical protein